MVSGSPWKWSVPDVAREIESMLFRRLIEGPQKSGRKGPTKVWHAGLRPSEMKTLLKERYGREISDKTLRDATRLLLKQDRIVREQLGPKEVRYSFAARSRKQNEKFMSGISHERVNLAVEHGAVGNLGEGWSTYGIGPSLRRPLRRKLRERAMSFREDMDELLENEEEAFMRELKKRCLRVMGEVETDTSVNAVEDALEQATDMNSGLLTLIFSFKFIEDLAPGILSEPPVKLPDNEEDLIHALSLRFGYDEDDLREYLRRSYHSRTWIQKMHKAFSPSDRRWLKRRLTDLMMARLTMCAVVHV